MKLTTQPAGREGGYFPRVTSYRYRISTGPRCTGLISARKYTTSHKAYEAGERMIKKLEVK